MDPSKLTIQQLLSGLTLPQLWTFIGTLAGIVAIVFVAGTRYGKMTAEPQPELSTGNRALNSEIVPQEDGAFSALSSGQILATHYPTGELFALSSKSNELQLVTARLDEPTDFSIRSNGEIVVLSVVQKVESQTLHSLTAVDPRSGHHRYISTFLSPERMTCLALARDPNAFVVTGAAVYRVNLDNGDTSEVLRREELQGCLSLAVLDDGRIGLTTDGDSVLLVDLNRESVSVLTEGDRLLNPRGIIQRDRDTLLVGTAGEGAGVVSIRLRDGAQSLLATGPFFTVTDIAIEEHGTLIVADNGRGAPGDGFVARVYPATRRVEVLVSQERTDWSFLNGRSVAIFP